jgi:hypothetical protein
MCSRRGKKSRFTSQKRARSRRRKRRTAMKSGASAPVAPAAPTPASAAGSLVQCPGHPVRRS